MIKREVLMQMGFIKGRGFDHEVLYHHSDCWVHYGARREFERYDGYGSNYVHVNGDTDSMEHFFAEFIENVQAGEANRHMEVSEEW